MPNYKEKIAEFENNFSTVIDKSVRELSMVFDNLYFDKNAKEIPLTILRWQASTYHFCCLGMRRCKLNVMNRTIIIMLAITTISKQNAAR